MVVMVAGAQKYISIDWRYGFTVNGAHSAHFPSINHNKIPVAHFLFAIAIVVVVIVVAVDDHFGPKRTYKRAIVLLYNSWF